jgi:demethylmenaquinone methyltransferase/2-methoxy-6-polyprenyl-1,4-benzoquinol methylase
MGTSGEHYARQFFPGTGWSYDLVVAWTTFGLDARWKRRLLDLLPPSRVILDLACGTGILTFALLDRFPNARIVGVDITEDYLAVARAKHKERGGDIVWLQGDAVNTPVGEFGPFDAIVSCYIPKYVDPERLLDNVHSSLRPGGVILLQDFTRPIELIPRLSWRASFALMEATAPRLHPEWRNVFDGNLRHLIEQSNWVTDFMEGLQRRGYEAIRVHHLTFKTAAIVAARKPATDH